MILYTSDINKTKRSRQTLKTAVVYLGISVFCIIFNNVYALFGHGVHSASMTLMFLYPLLAGVLPFVFLWIFTPQANGVKHYRFLYNCYNSGITALVIGSALNGIFEIAGTSSPYLIYFTVCGWTMLSLGLIGYLLNLYHNNLSSF